MWCLRSSLYDVHISKSSVSNSNIYHSQLHPCLLTIASSTVIAADCSSPVMIQTLQSTSSICISPVSTRYHFNQQHTTLSSYSITNGTPKLFHKMTTISQHILLKQVHCFFKNLNTNVIIKLLQVSTISVNAQLG